MKNVLMTVQDKILLRKRSVIESVNDHLKNISPAEHSRHSSFITNLIVNLIAFSFQDKKPAVKFDTGKSNQIVLFA